MRCSHRCFSRQIHTREFMVCTDAVKSRNYFHHGELFFITFREIDLRSLIGTVEDSCYRMGINLVFSK